MVGNIFSGERCVLHCAPGFRPAAKRTAVCGLQQNWVPSSALNCIPTAKPAEIHEKPFIKCPADMNFIMPPDQNTVYVRLEQPKTNVDWHKNVDSHPAWGKQLQAELPIGETVVTFRARSPKGNLNDLCRVLITVKGEFTRPLPTRLTGD